MFLRLGILRMAFAAMFFFATAAPRLFGYALEGPTWPARFDYKCTPGLYQAEQRATARRLRDLQHLSG